jgi:succinate dehydrogenase/fumarate reductase flavoprotein subunit
VLLLHRHLDHTDVLTGITAALSVGSVGADVVAVEAAKPASNATTTAGRGLTTPAAGHQPHRTPPHRAARR